MLSESLYFDTVKLLQSYEYHKSKESKQWIRNDSGDTFMISKNHPTHWNIDTCIDQAGKIYLAITTEVERITLRKKATGDRSGKKIEQVEYFLSMIKLAL